MNLILSLQELANTCENEKVAQELTVIANRLYDEKKNAYRKRPKVGTIIKCIIDSKTYVGYTSATGIHYDYEKALDGEYIYSWNEIDSWSYVETHIEYSTLKPVDEYRVNISIEAEKKLIDFLTIEDFTWYGFIETLYKHLSEEDFTELANLMHDVYL